MELLNETKFLMKKYNITANKSLGQNFLIDEEVILNTIKKAEIAEEDLVIEIGPGLGTLTNYLLRYAGKVIAVELDKRMMEILEDRFKFFDNFEVINEDILKLDLNKIIEENKKDKVKIVANLPYYITTPIIMKLLEGKANFDSITVMVQKEVADRLCAKTGTREAGAITYAVEYYSQPEKLFVVPNTSFIPEPNVESEVINLKVKKEKNTNVKSEEKLFKLIKYAFMQRRKTFINAIQNIEICQDKEHIRDILNKLNIDERIRGEALNLEDFINISNLL
ncbi:MAG: 16S rRNA (adenine(1518)-N(6)/adenine(1519)-N(6))-dimethyltransferase RsmA [Clostridia bacterium]|nr:16S rRNA (adenine(1518)-N(6)/adenine(1519)-N(6))-dimethyltransferase RsmA [Clostridia bacterium]